MCKYLIDDLDLFYGKVNMIGGMYIRMGENFYNVI